MDEIQSPPSHRSPPDDDYAGELSDSPSSERRRYQRGGRKKSERGERDRDSRMPPVPKPTTPEDEPAEGETLEEFNNRLQDMNIAKQNADGETHEEPEPQTNGHHYEERDEERDEEQEDAEDSDTVCDKCKQKPAKKTKTKIPAAAPAPAESPFETGIRAFNVKRAQGSGGRSIGVRATSGSEKGKKSAKNKKKSKKKAKKVESSSEESEEDDDGEEKRKPMSIKLELNLMIEIFLKAKIKGDVTITFLE